MPESLQANLEAVREAIRASTERASRDANAVALVAVTKTIPVERIREAIRLGLHTFGENRVQEAMPKMDEIGPAGVDWHLIGHLQTNKVKFIEGRFQMVQSVDGAGLAETLDARLQSPLDVLVEVNVGQESQKTGAPPADVTAVASAVHGSRHLRLRGLMTVAPMVPDPEAVRSVFRQLRCLRDDMSQRLG